MSREDRVQIAQDAIAQITPLILPDSGSTQSETLTLLFLRFAHQDPLELTSDNDNSGGAAALYSDLAINDWITGEGKYRQTVLQNMGVFLQGHPNFLSR